MNKQTYSPERKASMAQGRRETNIVKRYLSLVEQSQQATSKRTAETITGELSQIDAGLKSARGLEKLNLIQERENLERELLEIVPEDDGQTEAQFIAIARTFGDRKGISYSSWREFGVPKEVLLAAGIERTRRPNTSSN